MTHGALWHAVPVPIDAREFEKVSGFHAGGKGVRIEKDVINAVDFTGAARACCCSDREVYLRIDIAEAGNDSVLADTRGTGDHKDAGPAPRAEISEEEIPALAAGIERMYHRMIPSVIRRRLYDHGVRGRRIDRRAVRV
jgi:hypothetical protein